MPESQVGALEGSWTCALSVTLAGSHVTEYGLELLLIQVTRAPRGIWSSDGSKVPRSVMFTLNDGGCAPHALLAATTSTPSPSHFRKLRRLAIVRHKALSQSITFCSSVCLRENLSRILQIAIPDRVAGHVGQRTERVGRVCAGILWE